MFDYTRVAIDKTVQDIKNFKNGFDIFTQAFYLFYLVLAIFLGTGSVYANIILATVSLTAFIFYFLLFGKAGDKYEKLRRIKNHSLKAVKLVVNGFTLGVSIYGIYVASSEIRFINLLFALLSLVMWMFGLLVEVITYIIEDRYDYFKEAIELDKESFTKPIGAVGNFIKKAVGAEPTPEPERKPNRHTRALDAQLAKKKASDRDKKERKRAERAERAAKIKHERIAAKAAKRQPVSNNEEPIILETADK